MSFYLINQDPESPIMAIKSSSLVNLELVFKERECNKWVAVISEWFDGKGPFRAVWQRGDELRIRTIASHDDHSFEALISHPISEREIEVLLTTLVHHNCLKQEYMQDVLRELTCHFAIMRLLVLQKQVIELLQQLSEVDRRGVIYLNRIGKMEGFPITPESKTNILASMKQLKQMELITKMMAEKKVITKEEIMLFRSFKSSCYIKSEFPLESGWFADKSFAEEVALFVRDFDRFLADSLARSVSASATRFWLSKPGPEQKLFVSESSRKTCTIL